MNLRIPDWWYFDYSYGVAWRARAQLLNSFLSSMPPGSNYMGWWPEEGPGVARASTYGIATIASE